MDFSILLADKTESIVEKWVVAVRKDRQIETADELSYTAIRDHIPDVLKGMVTVLSTTQGSDIKSIVTFSWEHGVIRAEQGFDPTEIAREYRLLRMAIFDTLEEDLLGGTASEIIRSMRLIDAVIDEAIARCFNSYVEERLRELQQLYSSLMLNNEELTRLIRSNQDNLSHLAHELKSPLTSIIGYSDLFLRQERKKTEVKDSYGNLEHIERVLHNGRHLLRLINNMLEISQYEAGKMKLHLGASNVSEIIDNVWHMLQYAASAKNLQIIVDCELASKEIITDSLLLQQIVTNLVSNAIRYTEAGTIKITARMLDDKKWTITVSDSGIGIAPSDQKRIFDPYFRAGAGDKPYVPDSTGLGLAIVSRLVNLLQGEIEVVSSVGIGSSFTVTLPLTVNKSS
jgi:signal transduction histidine kinase